MADDSIYYELLGVDRNASDEDIKKAYRRLVFLYHPDRNPGNDEALKQFRLVSEAFQYLSNLERKSESTSSTEEDPASKSEFVYHTQQTPNAEPRCPGCSITGMEHISARSGGGTPTDGKRFISSPFIVVFCNNCGHVYTVTGA